MTPENDRFVFDDGDSGTATAADTIVSFASNDLIDLAAIDADAGLGGDQAFVWRGAGAFTGLSQLRYTVVGSDKFIEANVSGDLAADFQIVLVGYAGTPNSGDFVL